MTTDRTGPVLDLERLDAAADEALAGVRLDLSAVRAKAAVQRRRHGLVRRVAFIAVAAAVVLLVAAMTGFAGALGVMPPQPAGPLTGPGALPTQVYAAPRLLERVDRAPIGRVAVVLSDVVTSAGWRVTTGEGPVLVSADGGEYRRLPAPPRVGALSVSADGRVVAWADPASNDRLAPDPERPLAGSVRWVDVATGRTGSAGFGYAASDRATVKRTSLSPDGRTLVVQLWIPIPSGSEGTYTATTWTVDTRSGAVRRLCVRCVSDVAWDASGRALLVKGVTIPGTVTGVLPANDSFTALEQDSLAAVQSFVSADGTRRLVVAAEPGQGGDAAGPMRLVELRGGNAVRTTDLGSAFDAVLLAWDGGDTAWVSVRAENDDRYVVRRTTLGSVRSDEVLPYAGPSAPRVDDSTGVVTNRVVALSADVVAGGRTAQTPPPAAAPWWSPASLRLFLGEHWYLLGSLTGLLVVLLVPPLRRSSRRWRPVPPPSRIARAADEAARDLRGRR